MAYKKRDLSLTESICNRAIVIFVLGENQMHPKVYELKIRIKNKN